MHFVCNEDTEASHLYAYITGKIASIGVQLFVSTFVAHFTKFTGQYRYLLSANPSANWATFGKQTGAVGCCLGPQQRIQNK